jgi:hypothetical protein
MLGMSLMKILVMARSVIPRQLSCLPIYDRFAMRDVIVSTVRCISRNALCVLEKFALVRTLLQCPKSVP